MKVIYLPLFLAALATSDAEDSNPAAPVDAAHTNAVARFSPSLPLPVPPYIIEKLALTPGQQAKLADLKTQYGTEYPAASAKIQAANRAVYNELRSLKSGDKVDRWRELSQQMTKNSQLLHDLNEQYKTKFTDLLTPEQKATYTALAADAKLPQLVYFPILAKLQLSAEQQIKYQALLKEYRTEVQKTDDQRKKITADIEAAYAAGEKEKVAERKKQSMELVNIYSATRTRYLEQFTGMLTAEQKATYAEATRSRVTSRPKMQ
jgi:hypothetical protein